MKLFYTVIFTIFLCSFSFAQGNNANLKQAQSPFGESAPVDSSQKIADIIVNSKIPVFVDFWAVWCGPCKMLNPIIAELEKKYDGKILFLKVNVDIHRSIANYFKINAIPAVYIIKDKTAVNMIPGLQPKDVYVKALDDVLLASAKPETKSDSSKTVIR